MFSAPIIWRLCAIIELRTASTHGVFLPVQLHLLLQQMRHDQPMHGRNRQHVHAPERVVRMHHRRHFQHIALPLQRQLHAQVAVVVFQHDGIVVQRLQGEDAQPLAGAELEVERREDRASAVRLADTTQAQHEVADLGMHVLLLRAAQAIVEVHKAAGRHAEADGRVRSWLPGDAAVMDAAAGGKVAAAAVADKGLVAGEQSVLFRGKVLNAGDKLEDLGIAPGDVLNVLKGRKARAPKAQLPKEVDSYSTLAPKASEGASGMAGMSPEDMMKNMDPEKISSPCRRWRGFWTRT